MGGGWLMQMSVYAWIDMAFWLLKLIIIADAILTWIPTIDRRHPAVMFIRSITEPMYRPIRRLIPPERTGYLDISPIIVLLGLTLLENIIIGII